MDMYTLLSCSTKEMISRVFAESSTSCSLFLFPACCSLGRMLLDVLKNFLQRSLVLLTQADSFAFERLVFVKDRYDFKISEDAAQNPCRRWDVCCLGYFFIRFWQLIPLLPSLWRMSRLNISLCEPNWAQMLQRLCSSVSCFVLLWKLIARLLFRDEKCG